MNANDALYMFIRPVTIREFIFDYGKYFKDFKDSLQNKVYHIHIKLYQDDSTMTSDSWPPLSA